jgi:hypothetical protein
MMTIQTYLETDKIMICPVAWLEVHAMIIVINITNTAQTGRRLSTWPLAHAQLANNIRRRMLTNDGIGSTIGQSKFRVARQ